MMVSKFIWFWQRRKYRSCTIVWDGSCPLLKVRVDRYIYGYIPDGWFATDELFR